MLVDNISSPSKNNPAFIRSVKVEGLYENILIDVLPLFFQSFSQKFTKKTFSETDYSQNFGIILDRYLKNNPTLNLIIRENTKNIYTKGANTKKMPDFTFISSVLDAKITPLYDIEAKRLPTDKENGDRETEYVHGQSKKDSGGIERFKTGSHGYGLPKSAMLGYIEEDNFGYWHQKINEWIFNKASSTPSEWNINEQLIDLFIDTSQNYSITRFVANRESDSIDLFHLWIKMPN